MRNYKDKLKKYFKFSKEETLNFVIVVIALAFIYSWNAWGIEKFDAKIGFENLLFAVILMAITIFIHHAGQRMYALTLGFRAEQKLWWYGPLIGLFFAALTQGKIIFLAASGTTIHLLPAHRLGAFRYGTNITTLAKISLAGPVSNILFSALVKSLEWVGMLPGSIATPLFNLNIVFAAWNLLPIPPLDGSKILFYSRLAYVFLFATVASYVSMVYFLNFYSYTVALLIGVLAWMAYFIFVEHKWK